MKLPQSVFFDLGETLVTQNIEDNLVTRQALNEVVGELDLKVGPDELYRLYRVGYRHNQPIRSHHNIEIPISTWMRELLRHAIGKEPTAQMVRGAEGIVVKRRAANSVGYPDAESTLEELRTNAKIGVVSNVSSHDVASQILVKVGLERHVDVLVTSASTGVRKPDPGIFLYALSELGVKAKEAWHVGDHPRNDIVGASIVGIQTVLVVRKGKPTGRDKVSADFVVHTLDAIPGLLGG